MLVLSRKAPDAIEQIIRFVEWRKEGFRIAYQASATKRDKENARAAYEAMNALAEDLRTAVNNGYSLKEASDAR